MQGFKGMKRWKYVEIVNENEVREHLNYIFPYYQGMQVYINSTHDRKLVKIGKNREFIYEAR